MALGLAAAGLGLLVVALARLAVALGEITAAARGLVADVAAVRLAVEGLVPLAGEVARDATAGEAGLARLEHLKTRRDGRGSFESTGAGPVSLPIRPPPAGPSCPPPQPGSAHGELDRNPEELRRPGP
jgi:hypothetical protein